MTSRTQEDEPESKLALFEAIARGSDKAFAELNRRIERAVRWQLGHDAGEADVQDVCDRIRDKLDALRGRAFVGDPRAFRTYLARIVATQVVDVRRDAARRVSLDAVIDLPQGGSATLREVAAAMIERGDVVDRLGRRERDHLVREAIDRLDERCRRLLWEREVEESSEREIGARLGLTVTNVGVSLHRCRERLYRLLLATRCRALDRDWERAVARLADGLEEPLRTVFTLWWSEHRPVRHIAARLARPEREVKDLLARAKAAVWRRAEEAGRA